jgi:phage-related protein
MEIVYDPDVREFIFSLESSTRAKVFRMIGFLEKFGHEIRPPYSKKVSDELFELRVRGVQEVRVFYTFYNSSAYLLHGFVKKSQKLPAKELGKAVKNKRLLTDYNR